MYVKTRNGEYNGEKKEMFVVALVVHYVRLLLIPVLIDLVLQYLLTIQRSVE